MELSISACCYVTFIAYFKSLPPSLAPEDVSATKRASKSRRRRDPLIQEGKPLPEFGTCTHYKKSHRWLR